MFKTFAYFVCLYFTVLLVINGQTLPPSELTLPPLETLPPDASMNTSSIISPYDETCINADNSTDQDNVVYLGAVALNNDNECEVICQKQILQSFQIIYFGIVRTRAVITGSIFMASMPDNSTCAQTGICTEGICNVSAENSTEIPMTTMAMNSTDMTTMLSNSTEAVTTNSTETTNSTVTPQNV